MQLWSSNWLVLLDHSGDPIVGCCVSDPSFQNDSTIHIQDYLVRILKPLSDVMVPVIPTSMDDAVNDRCKSQKITYSTCKDLDCGRMKSYDGFLELRKKDNFMILSNAKGNQIACRFQKPKESFHVGAKVFFPLHVVWMGATISAVPQKRVHDEPSIQVVSAVKGSKSTDQVLSSESVQTVDSLMRSSDQDAPISYDNSSSELSLSVHDSISLGLDFSHGINFASDVHRKFASNVHSSANSSHFIMVVSFGRSTFKLSEDRVRLCLEAILGGLCGEFKVSILRDQVFSFCGASKHVGFHIFKIRKFVWSQFKCLFHLWGRGGPNWSQEFHLWQREEESEWTLVSPSKRISQHALQALKKPRPKSIISKVKLVGKKLNFVDNLVYLACKGYRDPTECKGNSVIILDNLIPDGTVRVPFGSFLEYFPGESSMVSNDKVSHEASLISPESPINDFEAMINEMVAKVYECGHCLCFGHKISSCTNQIHCKGCFHYSHIKKNYFNSAGRNSRWVPKVIRSKDSVLEPPIPFPAISSPLSRVQTLLGVSTPSPSPSVLASSPASSYRPSIAVFELDPARWVPHGHQIEDGGPTRSPRMFYTPSKDPP
jgi:hypothetical protein